MIIHKELLKGSTTIMILKTISEEDSYGYQIIKDMKPYLELSESTLYTILKRLETAQLLTVRNTLHDGRLRKYYRITESGRNRLSAFREEWQELMDIYRFVTRGECNHEES